MRVISGKYKGHQLVSFSAGHIRPTTDRVKETLFNTIQLYLDETSVVADCFSGTGSLGIEALSRGAKFVYFIDDSKKSIQILKKNLDKLKIPKDCYKILNQDVLDFFAKQTLSDIDLYLIDPPFKKKMADTTLDCLSHNSTLKKGAVISIESIAQEPIADEYLTIRLIQRKRFQDKSLSIFEISDVV